MKQYVKPSTCEVHVMAQNLICNISSILTPDIIGGGGSDPENGL